MYKILFRVDGGKEIGMGHLIRCLVLAKELRNKNHNIIFLIKNYKEAIKEIKKNNFHFVILKNEKKELEHILQEKPKLIIFDILKTDPKIILELKKQNIKTITLDDEGKGCYCADVMINAILPVKYKKPSSSKTKIYSGYKYIILDKRFSLERFKKNTIKEKAKNLLITFGGSDKEGVSLKVVRALRKLKENIKIKIIVGPAFSKINILRNEIKKSNLCFKIFINPKNRFKIMKNADLAICAGGITLFEFACLGVPSVIICQEKHQMITANKFSSFGAGINLGMKDNVSENLILNNVRRLLNDRTVREKISMNAMKLIDGRGLERGKKIIEGILYA